MRITDDRYSSQRAQLDLALRMIRHQARTGTIRRCTGLSDDRIRKLYATYFKANSRPVHRLRGKTPRQSFYFVRNALTQSESTTLALLYTLYGLIHFRPGAMCRRILPSNSVTYGERVCSAFEAYQTIHPDYRLSFERAWCLLDVLAGGDELDCARCPVCDGIFVNDILALDDGRCPCCRLKALK